MKGSFILIYFGLALVVFAICSIFAGNWLIPTIGIFIVVLSILKFLLYRFQFWNIMLTDHFTDILVINASKLFSLISLYAFVAFLLTWIKGKAFMLSIAGFNIFNSSFYQNTILGSMSSKFVKEIFDINARILWFVDRVPNPNSVLFFILLGVFFLVFIGGFFFGIYDNGCSFSGSLADYIFIGHLNLLIDLYLLGTWFLIVPVLLAFFFTVWMFTPGTVSKKEEPIEDEDKFDWIDTIEWGEPKPDIAKFYYREGERGIYWVVNHVDNRLILCSPKGDYITTVWQGGNRFQDSAGNYYSSYNT